MVKVITYIGKLWVLESSESDIQFPIKKGFELFPKMLYHAFSNSADKFWKEFSCINAKFRLMHTYQFNSQKFGQGLDIFWSGGQSLVGGKTGPKLFCPKA